MKRNILTITLNPAVDLATSVPEVISDVKLRCGEAKVDPGGGGINVARAVGLLGGHATALIAIGGATGAELLKRLAFEGVPTVAIQGPGETRMSWSVMDRATGEQLRFVLPGSNWSEVDVSRAISSIDQAVGEDTLVVLSGSQPPGVAKDFPSILADHLAGRGARLIVDTSGPALFHLAEAPHEAIATLRMDSAEAEELAGRALNTPEETARFASELVARGVAGTVILARGADGSVLANGGGAWHARSADVEVVSKVGAGDSFVGAYTLSEARGEAPAVALAWGVAAASAAVTSDGTSLCDLEVTRRLFESCDVRSL